MVDGINLETLSLDDLRALENDVKKLIKKRETEDKKAAVEAAKQLIRDRGYDPDEALGIGKTKAKTKLPPKYKDPNSDKTWSGKGPTPAWAKPYRENDRLEELRLS